MSLHLQLSSISKPLENYVFGFISATDLKALPNINRYAKNDRMRRKMNNYIRFLKRGLPRSRKRWHVAKRQKATRASVTGRMPDACPALQNIPMSVDWRANRMWSV